MDSDQRENGFPCASRLARGNPMKRLRVCAWPRPLSWSCAFPLLLIVGIAAGCGGGGSSMSMAGNGMGTIVVSVSDPPSCKNPNGSFEHVYITVRSVQAHVDPKATESSSGWQELAPQLANQPMQIDLFSTAETNCILAQLGSASLPVGSYQQIRLLLVSNAPGAS